MPCAWVASLTCTQVAGLSAVKRLFKNQQESARVAINMIEGPVLARRKNSNRC
jgi:hypothetical protein